MELRMATGEPANTPSSFWYLRVGKVEMRTIHEG